MLQCSCKKVNNCKSLLTFSLIYYFSFLLVCNLQKGNPSFSLQSIDNLSTRKHDQIFIPQQQCQFCNRISFVLPKFMSMSQNSTTHFSPIVVQQQGQTKKQFIIISKRIMKFQSKDTYRSQKRLLEKVHFTSGRMQLQQQHMKK